jgi:TonB family protein
LSDLRKKDQMSRQMIGLAVGIVGVLSLGAASLARTQPQTPRDQPPRGALATSLQRFEQEVALFEKIAASEPHNASAQHIVGTFYFEKTRDATLSEDDKRACIERGLAAEERALAASPDFVPALVYKNLLLRVQSTLEPNPATREALIRDADALRARALQLQRETGSMTIPEGTIVTPGPPPPPPPPPPGGGAGNIRWVYADTDYTAPGARPVKTKDVRPIYAPMVMASGIKGDVVLEATVDPHGKVAMVRVVRTLPMLTQATIDAVRQWEFDPLTVGAEPVVVTVTASFKKP